MPRYFNGDIVLSQQESVIFYERMRNPDLGAAIQRDAFLSEIEDSVRIERTPDGVYLDIEDAEVGLVSTIDTVDTYFVTVEAMMRGWTCVMQSTEKIKDKLSFSSLIKVEKEPISYLCSPAVKGNFMGEETPNCA